MKQIIVLTIIATLMFSCDSRTKEAVSKKDVLFYVTVRSGGQIDTSKYSAGFSESEKTKLIYGKSFSFKQTPHQLSLYLIDGPPIDDEGLVYVLDSIGMIYSTSLVWGGHTSLITNNDSVREILDEAKNQILADPNLHCYQCRRYDSSPEIVFKNIATGH